MQLFALSLHVLYIMATWYEFERDRLTAQIGATVERRPNRPAA